MKFKFYGQLLAFGLALQTVSACDFCGCGPAGQFFGMLPILEGQYASLRTQQQLFRHPEGMANQLDGTPLRYDRLQSAELWLRWQPAPRWQIIAQLPWRYHQRLGSNGVASEISGIGDITLTTFYKWIQPNVEKTWQHGLSVGAQVGLPTGPYQQRDAQKRMLPPPFQTGTGSWSGMGQLFYTLSKGSQGVQLEARARSFTTNELDFNPGSAVGSSLQYFINRQGKMLRYMHYAGFTVDRLFADTDFGQPKAGTGGQVYGLSAGTDLYTSKSAWHLLAQLPVYQVMGAAQPVGTYRVMLGYSRAF